jgi:hypothetical protein
MAEPRKTVRIVKSPEFPQEAIRRWREGAEIKDRDNRPGHFSITGAFVALPESPPTTTSADSRANS